MIKVMLVDDEADLCFFLKKNLETAGEFEVMTCSESSKALMEIKQFKPDIVVIDVLMPGLSGPEIVEQMKADMRTKNTPTIFLTAIATSEDIETNQNIIGGHFMVAKPVEIDHLLKIIHNAIGAK